MKKILLFLTLALSLSGLSQENVTVPFKKNEVKGNALFLVLGAFEVTYERLLNEDSGLGASVFYISQDDSDLNFIFTPYYRAYFGKKTAAGFFIEGFTSVNSGVSTTYYDNNGNVTNRDRYTDLALGFGLGSKWIHKKGFLFEINAGIGRNLFSSDSFEVVPRGGITLGYRF